MGSLFRSLDLSICFCRNSDKNSGDEENDEEVDKDLGVDDDEWDSLQADIERPEAILEAKSKESHPVHAPYFPLVGEINAHFMLFGSP